jgi:Leucine-rich repeat (LRR) protein
MLRNVSSPSIIQQDGGDMTSALPPTLQSNTSNTASVDSYRVMPREDEREGITSSLKRPSNEKALALTRPPLKKAKAAADIFIPPPPLESLIKAVFNDPIILSTIIHVIDAVQKDKYKKLSLALTAVNKEAFRLRFMSEHLRSFHFHGAEIARFLTYCQEYVKEPGLRLPAHLYSIKSLSLSLVDELNITQSVALLAYLPEVTQLSLIVESNCRVDLGPLLKAAQALALEEVFIARSWGGRVEEHEDVLPDALFELITLRVLRIRNFNIQHISEKLGKLKNLLNLELSNLPLVDLPKSLGDLENLDSLTLRALEDLMELPKEMGALKKLTKLELFNLPEITVLPSSIGQLTQLEKLKLFGLSIDEIPEDISNLSKLVSLSLEDLDLTHLPDGLYRLPALSKLKLEGVTISTLSEALGNLTSLTSLEMMAVPLRELPASIGNLLNLRKLKLNLMSELVVLPEQMGNLHVLEEFELSETGKITTLPDSITQLEKLKTLILDSLDEFLAFPATINAWSALTMEMLEDSAGGKLLPDEFCSLPALTALDLANLPKLQALPQEFFLKKNLKLFIADVPIVHSPPPVEGLGFGHFSSLVMKSQASVIFYQAVLAALGENREVYEEEGSVKMDVNNLNMYWLAPYPAPDYSNSRIAFAVKTRAQVDAFYEAAIANGGIPQEQPGRGYKEPAGTRRKMRSKKPMLDSFGSKKIYVAYLCDPDGGELAALCWGEGCEE